MKPLPMPIRVVAGLVVTVLEEAEHLPRRIIEFPVTAVSQALQHAMRIQQTVTDLAIKGDRALGTLRPVPETPSWARFDEDEEPATPPRNGQGRRVARLDDWADARPDSRYDEDDTFSPPFPPVQPPRVTPVRILPDLELDNSHDDTGDNGYTDAAYEELLEGAGAHDIPEQRTADSAPAPVDPLDAAVLTESRSGAEDDAGGKPEPGSIDDTDDTTDATGTTGDAEAHEPGTDAPGGPNGLEAYGVWSLAQLRSRFRFLTPYQLQLLLDWESTHEQRAPYMTMLSNRIATVTEQ